MARPIIWVLATIAVIGAGAPAPAAAQNLPNQFVCPREIGESNADWKFRCDQEEWNEAQRRGENLARQSQDVAQQRAALEKQPALPATRNRILGRWAMPAAPRGATNDPFAGLSNMLTNGVCADPVWQRGRGVPRGSMGASRRGRGDRPGPGKLSRRQGRHHLHPAAEKPRPAARVEARYARQVVGDRRSDAMLDAASQRIACPRWSRPRRAGARADRASDTASGSVTVDDGRRWLRVCV